MNQILIADEYFAREENDKARTAYQSLAKNPQNHQYILSNYCTLLEKLGDNKAQEKFLKAAVKAAPHNFQYPAKLLAFYNSSNQPKKFQNYYDEILKRNSDQPYKISSIAKNLYNDQMYEPAEKLFLVARGLENNPASYSLDLAKIYMATDRKEQMIEEYLNHGSISGQIDYLKKILQSFLEKEDFDLLETMLIKKLQKDPENMNYAELMIWVALQKKDFYGAFVQAKAIDKRRNSPGDRTMQIGHIALRNKDYEQAQEIFEYVAKKYPDTRNYERSKKFALQSLELKIKNTYPIEKTSIRKLVNEYAKLAKQVRSKTTSVESLRRKALLHAFYLQESDSAIVILEKITKDAYVPFDLKSRSKLDLGDIYLLNNEPWEATLLYSQVEKSYENHPLSYDAKLKNAQLHYYTGNFTLAKSHLDILKKNTTREISNDAIAMGVTIADNTGLDTSDFVMQKFAQLELLIFQNRKTEAKKKLEQMLKDYPSHSLEDEIYWLIAKIELEEGKVDEAIEKLDAITSNFGDGILGDDAAFKKAEIFEYKKKDIEKAKTLYREFLLKYRGSVYAAEARKRFRKLRGDILE